MRDIADKRDAIAAELRQLSARAADQSVDPQDAHLKARKLLAAEYDRDGIPFVADCIRTDAMLSQVEDRAIRAIVAAMTLRPDHIVDANKMVVPEGLTLTDSLLEIGRKAVEDQLVEMRDHRLSIIGRGNGLVIREADGTASDVIRLSVESALRIGIKAMLAAAPQPEARNSCKHIHTTQSGDGLHVYCNTCNEDLSPQPEAKP